MFIDFQTAERESAASLDSCPRPIDARCWLTSEITCAAYPELTVPQEESGVQMLSACARGAAGRRVNPSPAANRNTRASRRCGVRLTEGIIGNVAVDLNDNRFRQEFRCDFGRIGRDSRPGRCAVAALRAFYTDVARGVRTVRMLREFTLMRRI